MSTFRNSVKSVQTECGEENPLRLAMLQRWPNLVDVLFGYPLNEEKTMWSPQFTVFLFTEGSRLKFILNCKGASETGYGTIPEPLDGFDGLEAALAGGQFSMRSTSPKKRS